MTPLVAQWDGNQKGLLKVSLGGGNRMRKVLMGLTVMLLALSLAIPGFSQLYSTVTGTVSDSSGALIPGVEIKATNQDTGVVSTTITNEAGVYNYRDLLPGRYTL